MDTKTLCLGALRSGPCSGYEIRKLFEEGPFGYFQDISFGSIYPALRRLSDDRLVTVTDQEQDGRPDKKVYELTAEGHDALTRMVATEPGDDKIRSDLLFALYFAELLPEDRLVQLIDDRIAMHESMVAALGSFRDDEPGVDGDDGVDRNSHCAPNQCAPESPVGRLRGRPGPSFVRGLGLTIHQACLDYYRENRNWLIESNRDCKTPPGDDDGLQSDRRFSIRSALADTISESST